MAPIQLGKLSVEIAVNNIDGFIHTLFDVPVKSGFWVTFIVKDDRGKTESFPLVDKNHKIKIYEAYPDALQAAAKMLMKTRWTELLRMDKSPAGPNRFIKMLTIHHRVNRQDCQLVS